jgi:hypothetical protein
VVNLRFTFWEDLNVSRTPPPAPVSPAQRVRARDGCGTIQPQLDPLILRQGSRDGVSFLHNLVPMRGSVELPGPRQAATFDFTLPFRRLPIDSRAVRACGVEVHLGTVSAADYAAGMRGATVNGVPLSVLDTRDANGRTREDTRLLVGTVDEWENEDDEKGGWIKVTGRDMRGLLLDAQLPVGLLEAVDPSKPIDEVVRQILCLHPYGDQFTVAVNAQEWSGRVLPPLGPGFIPRHRRGARGTTVSGGTTRQDLSYWDAITKVCTLVGAVPTFVGTELRIRPVRSVFDQLDQGLYEDNPSPFAGGGLRTAEGVEPFGVRKLVWGRDVRRLKTTHRLNGKAKPKVVRVIAHDPDVTDRARGRAVIEARWPPARTSHDPRSPTVNAVRTSVAPSGRQAQEEMVNIPVSGIRDPAQLTEIARALFEEVGRQELTGTLATSSLASFGGDNADPDLLRLKPGDAFELLCDVRALASRPPLVHSRTDLLRQSFDEAVAAVERQSGLPHNIARVVAATLRGEIVELQTFFRTATVKYGWDAEKGVDIDIDFQNYFVHHFNPQNRETGSPVASSAATRRRST